MNCTLRKKKIIGVLVILHIFFFSWYFSSIAHKIYLKNLEGYYNENYILHLVDDKSSKVFYSKNGTCFIEGTERVDNLKSHCFCKDGWKGKNCGLPMLIQGTSWLGNQSVITAAKRPHRVILFLLYDGIDDIMLLNLREVGDIVEAIVIGDIYSFANAKEVSFFIRKYDLIKGYLDKIIYVYVNRTVPSTEDVLDFVIDNGLRHLSDSRPDDILLFVSRDQVIRRDFILFLKLHSFYPNPVRCSFQRYLYGFYWKFSTKNQIMSPCAVTVLNYVNNFNTNYSFMKTKIKGDSRRTNVDQILPNTGWQCIHCDFPENLYRKLLKRPTGLRPKWFHNDYILSVAVLVDLIKQGKDFDSGNVAEATPKGERLPIYASHLPHLVQNEFDSQDFQY